MGSGVASISTGIPFTHPQTFQPYDPRQHLGLEPTVVLTHLASRRVLCAVAERLGHDLDQAQTGTALTWVKDRAYRLGQAVVADSDFAAERRSGCLNCLGVAYRQMGRYEEALAGHRQAPEPAPGLGHRNEEAR